jgi:hypothetical protein
MMSRVYAIPVALALTGLVLALFATGGAFWPLALGWCGAGVAVAVLRRVLAPIRPAQLLFEALVVAACVVLVFRKPISLHVCWDPL